MRYFFVDVVHITSASTWFYGMSGACMIAALLVRRMLALRVLLVVASALSFVANLLIGQFLLYSANLVYMAINLVQIALLVLERKPYALPDELKAIYRDRYGTLTTREFARWLALGERLDERDPVLCRAGGPAESLYLVVSGTVEVRRGDEVRATIEHGEMAGEMGFLSGQPYSADVIGRGEVRYVRWPKKPLDALQRSNPTLYMKVFAVLGLDVVHKLRREGAAAAERETRSTD